MIMWYSGCSSHTPPCTTSCYPADQEGGFEPLKGEYVKALIGNYRDNQWDSYRNQMPDSMDARSVWFSLATIKRFVHMIEDSACSSCWNPKPTLGLRIYYGTYHDADSWNPDEMHNLDPTYAGHHTVAMVATYFDEGRQLNVDFDPGHIQGAPACQPMSMQQIFAVNPKPLLRVLTPGVDEEVVVGMQNNGSLWPPLRDNRFDLGAPIICQGAELAAVVDQVTCQQ